MNIPGKKIVSFIKKHHVLTLATSVNNIPYCANCFYVYLEDENMFVFTSDNDTKHVQDVLQNSYVGGSVVLETSIIGKIQGIQFNGKMYLPEGDLQKKAKKKYMKRYPFAILMKTQLWVVESDFIKLTDNRLGFGKKLIWKKDVAKN
ncbi:MAG: pyridoxamine 5'-phosphate oxidase family protein [Bacteroidales bacterium]|nr:pyridoxamine 5'-phosphate oxidase family protein [Bacteroidales bacterium]